MTSLTHFTKDPAAIIDYTVRWTSWLVSGDTISSSSWFLDNDLVKTSESNTTTDAVIFVASGTVGVIYEITNRIITAGGRQNEQTLSILIENK